MSENQRTARSSDELTRLLPELLPIARSLAPRGIDPEDLLSDALTRYLARTQGGAPAPEHLKAYLATTMRNIVIDFHKSPRSRVDATEDTFFDDRPDDEPHGALRLRSADLHREYTIVSQAFAALEGEQRMLLEELLLKGRAPGEVGTVLGLGTSAVALKLFRAKAALRREVLMHFLRRGEEECQDNADRIASPVELSPDEHSLRQRGIRHVRECSQCRRNWAAFAAMAQALGILPLLVLVQSHHAAPAAAAASASVPDPAPVPELVEGTHDAASDQGADAGTTSTGTGGNAATATPASLALGHPSLRLADARSVRASRRSGTGEKTMLGSGGVGTASGITAATASSSVTESRGAPSPVTERAKRDEVRHDAASDSGAEAGDAGAASTGAGAAAAAAATAAGGAAAMAAAAAGTAAGGMVGATAAASTVGALALRALLSKATTVVAAGAIVAGGAIGIIHLVNSEAFAFSTTGERYVLPESEQVDARFTAEVSWTNEAAGQVVLDVGFDIADVSGWRVDELVVTVPAGAAVFEAPDGCEIHGESVRCADLGADWARGRVTVQLAAAQGPRSIAERLIVAQITAWTDRGIEVRAKAERAPKEVFRES